MEEIERQIYLLIHRGGGIFVLFMAGVWLVLLGKVISQGQDPLLIGIIGVFTGIALHNKVPAIIQLVKFTQIILFFALIYWMIVQSDFTIFT